MSTAVASAPAPPLAPPPTEPEVSPRSSYPTIAPSNQTPAQNDRTTASATPNVGSGNTPTVLGEGPVQQKISPEGKRSPNS